MQLTGLFIFFAALAIHAQAAELQRLEGVTLVPSRWNDGDSFKVLRADKELTIRLYYIDCAESHAGQLRPVVDASGCCKYQTALFTGHLKVAQKFRYDVYFLVAAECEGGELAVDDCFGQVFADI